jgi:formylglycine-generating enzyme required for sulfatase activity
MRTVGSRNSTLAFAVILVACTTTHEEIVNDPGAADPGDPPTTDGTSPDGGHPSGGDAGPDSGEPKPVPCSSDAQCPGRVCDVALGKCISKRSCTLGPGADYRCGSGSEDCCASIAVPGGSFTNTDVDGVTKTSATVSSFTLDEFEITVGRMRAFFTQFGGNVRASAPTPGAGAHPKIAGSGWRASFDARLPGSFAEIDERMTTMCSIGGDNANYGATTWTSSPGPNEAKPVNCIDWYTLYAFCIWDGGRLPTDAEWSYVALSGASENRTYPYGNGAPTWTALKSVIASDLTDPPSDPGYKFTEGPMYRKPTDGPLPIAPVGEKTERSKWGHADLTGNVIEMTLDVARSLPATCVDCANVAYPDPPNVASQPPNWQAKDAAGKPIGDEFGDARAVQDGIRLGRGSSWQGPQGSHYLENGKNRFWLPVWRTYSAAGGRCAR